ncbi:alpha/beta hydrolase [Streptomyces sp. P9-2B-2]|uniref:alpha/beta fold hydrolase n=1 Tax=Streptomyces TaxID=1883 RepID=UPI00224F5181|nr:MULTISPECIES: alpha/beta hydrolase [Streptomyces]MCX4634754.1 alpha/beta hydrolase [Streptomyces platensis]WJY41194.1 alpha/beta hydrolase [Streptomyces sp. P9-2B-2]
MTTHTPTGRYFPVNGGRVYGHVREGDGPALVFLHYWGGSHRTWRPVIERLGPAQTFVSYDHRGWGESTETPGPYGMEQLADDTQRVIDQLGYDDYVVVGHSMGGKAAQIFASRRPAGLKGVVLVAPAPPAPVGVTHEFQEALAHAYDNDDAIARSIDLVLTNGELSVEARRQVHEDSARAGEAARMAWPRQALVEDFADRVGAINVPVLVLAGSDDKVDPPQILRAHLLPLIPTATLTELSGTGHLSPLEVPDQIASHIGAFIARL